MDNNQNLNNSNNANWQQALNAMNASEGSASDQPLQAGQTEKLPEQPASVDMPQFTQENSFTALPAYDAANFAVMPIKKKNKLVPVLLIILVAAIVIGGGIFAYLTFFAKGSYEKIERSYFSGLTAQLEQITPSEKTANNISLTITPGSSINEGFGTDLAPTVISMDTFYDGSTKNGAYQIVYNAGTEKILTANMYLFNGEVYLQLPEISDLYINASPSVDTDDLDDALSSDTELLMASDITTPGSLYSGISEAMSKLTPDVAAQFMDILTEAYFETFSEKAEKSAATLTSCEITVECDAYTINFTQSDTLDMLITFFNKVEGDTEAMEILADMGIDSASFAAAKAYFEETKEELSEEDAVDVIFTMTVFTKGNEVLGRTIEGEGATIRIAHINNENGKFAYEISVEGDDEEDNVSAVAFGTTDGKNYNGVIEAKNSDSEEPVFSGSISITVDEFISGTLIFEGEDSSMEAVTGESTKNKIAIVFSQTSKTEGSLSVDCQINNESTLRVDMTASDIEYKEDMIPEFNDKNSFKINDTSSNAYKNFITDTEKFTSNFVNKITSIEKPDVILNIAKALVTISNDYSSDNSY